MSHASHFSYRSYLIHAPPIMIISFLIMYVAESLPCHCIVRCTFARSRFVLLYPDVSCIMPHYLHIDWSRCDLTWIIQYIMNRKCSHNHSTTVQQRWKCGPEVCFVGDSRLRLAERRASDVRAL